MRRTVRMPRYPITLAMIGMGMLGVFVGIAHLKVRAGSRDPVIKAAIVTQAVTILEQFLRLILEERLDLMHGRAHMPAQIKDLGRAVWVSMSRIDALGHGLQSVEAIERLADMYGLPLLRKCVEEMREDLVRLFDQRHALVHSLGAFRFDDVRHLAVVERFVRAVLAGRDKYLATALIVEASVMDAAGVFAGARKAAAWALKICRRHRDRAEAKGTKCDLWALLYTGHCLARLGRSAEAEAAYKEAAGAYPKSILPLVGMANFLVLSGRPQEAVKWYGKAAAVDPGNAAVRAGAGRALAAADDGSGIPVVQYYQAEARRGSGDAPFQTGHGTALALAGRHAEAAEQYRGAIAQDPDDAAARVGLGNAMQALGRHEDAARSYNAGIKRSEIVAFAPRRRGDTGGYASNPFVHELGGAAAHRGMGETLLKLGHHARAVDAMREATVLDPGDLDAKLGLGEALYASSRYAEAAPAYEAAARLDPGSLDARLGLGKALYEAGRYAEAAPAYEAAARLDPGSLDARLGLGKALYEAGRYAEAAPAYEAAARLDPGSLDARLGLGKALYEAGRYAEAAPAYEAAARLDPGSLDARLGLGKALYEAGRYAEAAPAYEAAARLDPANPDMYEELGHALDRVGRYAEGKEYRDRATEMRRIRWQERHV